MEAVKLQHSKMDYQGPYIRSANGRITGYYTPDGVLHECPEGYMTGSEFWQLVREDIKNFYKEHGLL
ncbi:hypothetical protein FACS1894182_09720 [Bacteroidia bacterium]|nr:hypothetical protein FACS1894182_09720 [Bacteroidia bacterium]